MLGLDMPTMLRGWPTTRSYRQIGKLRSSTGMLTCSIPAAIGDHCEISAPGRVPVLAEVIGFEGDTAYLLPFDAADDLRSGMTVIRKGHGLNVPTGRNLLGRTIDGLGRPIDKKGSLVDCPMRPVNRPSPSALDRARIRKPFVTGIRAIDSMLTCGHGQRIGIFAGSGVGKSTLLGEIAKGSEADVNVIALIGERGREVLPFMEDCLGEEGLARSVVILAACDESPIMRVRASQAAIAIADYFRESGLNVLFMIDSLTRLAQAQREIGLLVKEPPSARGYTPSVFRVLANTIERLGNAAVGGITALLTVLVDGDDLEEPVSDAVRSLVDGHIVLDRKIAESGRYPAINVARSISRVATDVIDREHAQAARKIRQILATYAEIHDMLRLGMYQKGSIAKIDLAIELYDQIEKFLRQSVNERSTFADTRAQLLKLASRWTW